jgi:uncharacterized protein (TIGR02452 family)
MSNKDKLALAAREVEAIQQRGWYKRGDGAVVSVEREQRAACAGTEIYLPEKFEALWAALTPGNAKTVIAVQDASTLSACRQLRQRFDRVGLLNFASAKNPGGGFLGGARAQEESLARSSGLYSCLLTQPAFYAFHRAQGTCLYSDRVIFAPDVPVIVDDHQRPLDAPFMVSMLTCPAVNFGALERNEPDRLPEVEAVMARRVRMVLAVACAHDIQALVLGALGVRRVPM